MGGWEGWGGTERRVGRGMQTPAFQLSGLRLRNDFNFKQKQEQKV